jgi:S1-C subfamily serine protease
MKHAADSRRQAVKTGLIPWVLTICCFLPATCCLLPTALAAPPDEVREAEAKRVAVIEKIRPAVVAVFAPGGQGGGSGVLIDPEGYALTNFHVVEGSGPVMQCGLADGVLYDSVLVGLDKVGDVALIKLFPKVKDKPFPFVQLGDSDKVRAGDWSFAMGNPFLLATDFTPTVTFGLVSGVHRYQYPAGTLLEYTDCIQIDTSINPGNSGGPLFNIDGELIGINGRGSFDKRGRVNSGVGYAISINQIKNFMGHLYAGIDTDHATLGATVKTMDGEEGEVPRILVQTMLDDCDAARRGLQVEDELVEFAGRSVDTVNQYKNVLGIFPKGWRVPLTYRRENRKTEILVRLQGLLPKEPTQPRPPGRPRPRSSSEAAKLYKAKPGYANAYFNDLARDKLLAQTKKHGDFAALTGKWLIEGELARPNTKTPIKFEIANKPDADSKTEHTVVSVDLAGVMFLLAPLKENIDRRELRDPPNSGGLLMALYHYQRLLTLGQKGFEAEFAHGGHEPFYPPAGDGMSSRFMDRRLECAVLNTEHAAVKCKWFFSKTDGLLLGYETWLAKDEDPCEVYFGDYKPVNGRQLPHRIEVRIGDETYGVIRVNSYQLSAPTETKP